LSDGITKTAMATAIGVRKDVFFDWLSGRSLPSKASIAKIEAFIRVEKLRKRPVLLGANSLNPELVTIASGFLCRAGDSTGNAVTNRDRLASEIAGQVRSVKLIVELWSRI
jgi:hypothetical protein